MTGQKNRGQVACESRPPEAPKLRENCLKTAVRPGGDDVEKNGPSLAHIIIYPAHEWHSQRNLNLGIDSFLVAGTPLPPPTL